MNKTTYHSKGYICYMARYLGWSALFAVILYLILVPLSNYIVSVFTSELASIISTFLLWLLALSLRFIALREVLNKVFFKPYKHIKITPKFPKLTFKITLKMYLIMFIPTIIALLLHEIFNIKFPPIYIALEVGLAGLIIKTNAEIEGKCENGNS